MYINEETKQRFELKQIVYCKSLSRYVQLKKFDAVKLTYLCRLLEIKHDAQDKKEAEKEAE